MPDDRRDELPTADAVARKTMAMGDRAVDRAQELAQEQKAVGAERVEHIAEAMRSSAETLEGTEKQLADLVGTAAGQLEGFARSLREKDLSALLAEVEDFGRRQPAVFIGAAVALGFGIARVAKAGSGAAGRDHRTGGHGHDTHRTADAGGRHTPERSGLGDFPGTAHGGPDRYAGLHESTTGEGPAYRPGSGS